MSHLQNCSLKIYLKRALGGSGWGGQDGCERRIKVFCENSKNIYIFFWRGRGGLSRSRVGEVRVDVNREVKFL